MTWAGLANISYGEIKMLRAGGKNKIDISTGKVVVNVPGERKIVVYEANYANSKPKGVTTQFDKKTIGVEKFAGTQGHGAAALTINMNSLFDKDDDLALKLIYAVGAENGVLLFEIAMDNSVKFLTKLSGQSHP